MLNEEDEKEDRNADDDESTVKSSNSRGLVFFQDGAEDLESCGNILDGGRLGGFGGWCFIPLSLLRGHFGTGSAGGRMDPDSRCVGFVGHPRVNVDVQNR